MGVALSIFTVIRQVSIWPLSHVEVENKIYRQMTIAYKSIIHKETKHMKKARYTKGFSMALRPDVFERIKAITDEREISMADWVREAAERALNNETEGGRDE